MNKVIENEHYNTNTADKLGTAEKDMQYTEEWRIETLYRTDDGKYFIHGKGGSMTRYAKKVYGVPLEGEKIIPLSEFSARKWAERNLDGEEYNNIFGAGVYQPEAVKVEASLPIGLYAELNKAAFESGETLNSVINRAINLWLSL